MNRLSERSTRIVRAVNETGHVQSLRGIFTDLFPDQQLEANRTLDEIIERAVELTILEVQKNP